MNTKRGLFPLVASIAALGVVILALLFAAGTHGSEALTALPFLLVLAVAVELVAPAPNPLAPYALPPTPSARSPPSSSRG